MSFPLEFSEVHSLLHLAREPLILGLEDLENSMFRCDVKSQWCIKFKQEQVK